MIPFLIEFCYGHIVFILVGLDVNVQYYIYLGATQLIVSLGLRRSVPDTESPCWVTLMNYRLLRALLNHGYCFGRSVELVAVAKCFQSLDVCIA